MRFPRRSGILLHPTSLPGPHGSGDLGAEAHAFVDWLAEAGQLLWQVLPLGGLGPGNSPYMSSSAFAGNVLLIDLAELQQRGWLTAEALATAPQADPRRIDFATMVPWRMARLAEAANKASGLKHGAVQDKLFLPGLRKLDMLRRAGFFGRMLSVRIEFGYWVFEGDLQPIQRPSWNYRSEDGGGMILDMMCHWRYVLDNLFGEVKSITCLGATHIPKRWDEAGKPYAATADDAAYATAQLKGHNGEPVVAQLTMSWATRVRRDDLVTFHVDGTHGSAVAGLQECRMQPRRRRKREAECGADAGGAAVQRHWRRRLPAHFGSPDVGRRAVGYLQPRPGRQ